MKEISDIKGTERFFEKDIMKQQADLKNDTQLEIKNKFWKKKPNE